MAWGLGRLWLLPLVVAALAAPAAAEDTGGGADSSVAALLARMPATVWGPDAQGFHAVDLAALRDLLDVTWPEEWPATNEAAGRDGVVAVLTALRPFPRALSAAAMSAADPLAGLGMTAARLDGLVDSGLFFGQLQLTVLVGDGLADVEAMGAALAAAEPTAVERLGGAMLWQSDAEAWPDVARDGRVVAVAPDMVAIQPAEADVAALLAALGGEGATLADVPEVAALLEASIGTWWPRGRLVELWAGRPEILERIPNLLEGGWPADSALPRYELFAGVLRDDGSRAAGLIVLVYAEAAAAERAAATLQGRIPMIAEAIMARQIGVDRIEVSVVAASNGLSAVVVEARAPLSDRVNRGEFTAYNAWTKRVLAYFDPRIILP